VPGAISIGDGFLAENCIFYTQFSINKKSAIYTGYNHKK